MKLDAYKRYNDSPKGKARAKRYRDSGANARNNRIWRTTENAQIYNYFFSRSPGRRLAMRLLEQETRLCG